LHGICLTGASLLVLLLAACGSGSSQAPNATSTTQPFVPSVAASAANAATTPDAQRVSSTPVVQGVVVWSTDADPVTGAPGSAVAEVPQSAVTIHASLQTESLSAGTTVTADWTIDGTPIPGVTKKLTVDQARGAGWIEFHLDWTGTGTWPRGALGIAIAIDGVPTGSGSVQIVAG
jgi:hypothetical protein